MKKQKILIVNIVILVILLSGYYYLVNFKYESSNNKDLATNNTWIQNLDWNNPSNDENIKKTVIKKNIDAKKVDDYNSFSGELVKYSGVIEVKNGLYLYKNYLDNLISYCDYAEGKTDYILESGKKETQNTKFDLYSSVSGNISSDYKWRISNIELEKKNIKDLLSWVVPESYKIFTTTKVNKLNEKLFNNDKELFLYNLWNYMFSLQDKNQFDTYSDFYLDYLEENQESFKDWVVRENYIYPLLNAYLDYYKECNSFIKLNFINY